MLARQWGMPGWCRRDLGCNCVWRDLRRDEVPKSLENLHDSVTANFGVISPKDFRMLP
ncbi:MAG: hypothetical protein WBF22_15685 [Methylocella sp.]